ncbi:MAG TPA: glycoside hydrolase family 16 protein [Bacillota bacterium]|nr:glycoside hydrolase family 16 protein [Bacillota bacterium]
MGKRKMRRLVLSLVLLLGLFQIPVTWGAPVYTSGATEKGTAEVNLWFKPNGWTAQYVIVHYTVSGKVQENVYMKYDQKKGEWDYLVRGLKPGQTINYSFTYNISGIQYDSPGATYPSGGTTSNYMYNKMVWSDEFDGSALKRENWNYQLGNGFNPGVGYFDGWGNGEWEWYREANVSVTNGNLVIKGEYLSTPYVFANRNWYQFSGRITTKGLRSWKYARVEARIKLPTVNGTWPAFWMMGNSCDATVNGAAGGYDKLPTNWASCGEIDIMEHKNTDTQICSNLYWDTRTGIYPWASDTNAGNPTWTSGVDVTQYHVYAVEWNTTTLKYYLDGKIIKTQDISASSQEEFHTQNWFIIMNMAVSGSFTGPTTPNQSDFPCYMYVDYVRVYQ